jgi:uncharacterized membrane protein YeiH
VAVLWGVLLLCALAMVFLRQRHFRLTEKAIQVPDALGLGLFAATGVHQALLLDLPAIVAVLMGVITGVFGGVLRDVVCNQIPSAFHGHRPYAVCAFVGGWVYVGLWQLAVPGWVALIACVGVTAGLRGLALWLDWRLPVWRE